VLTQDDLPLLIWPLPVRRINGIGPKAGAKLATLGIKTIADLAAADKALLAEHFGRGYARWLHDAAHGRDERPLSTSSEPVSVSRETTFDRDLSASADRSELGAILDELVRALAHDLQKKGYLGKTVGIKLRFDDFKTVTRDLTLDAATAEAETIRHAAGLCLKRVDFSRRIRLMGVRMASLRHAG
jgi:DNA polymerase IV